MRDLKAGFFFFALSLFVLWESLRAGLGTLHKPGSGFISFCAGVVLAALSLMLVYQGWGLRKSQKPLSLRVILAFASLFVYSLVLESFGYLVATFLLVGIFFRLGENRRWWVLLGMSVSVALLTYVIFGILLRVYFPRGFLGI
jgi:putative tricarboxylic transport membrane protein